jgi:hypothetical protein
MTGMIHSVSLENAFGLAGPAGELLLLLILFFRRSYRNFPIFSAYLAWLLVSDPLLLVLYWQHGVSGPLYYRTYLTFNCIQYAIELAVLFEIAANVLQPAKRLVHKKVLAGIAISIALGALIAFLIAADLNASTLAHSRIFQVINATMAILRLAIFLLIAGFSQVLGLNWKNHVLQLTSGLAFYAVVTLIVELGHSHLRGGPDYEHSYYALEHLRVSGYLCTLYFWCYAFAKKEAPRKDFSPQMTKILVSLSGSAKRQSAVLARTRDQ